MNSVEALNFAIARLDKVRTSNLDEATEAITTLTALRDLIAANEEATA